MSRGTRAGRRHRDERIDTAIGLLAMALLLAAVALASMVGGVL